MSRPLGNLSRFRAIVRLSVTLLVASVAVAALPESAHAQTTDGFNDLGASPKGAIGLGLIGAEIGLVVPAALGLDETWSLIVFPVVGAAAGALGGHYGIDENDMPELAVAMLATGIVLIVPAIVGTMAAIAYDPDDDEGDSELEVEPVDGEDEEPSDAEAVGESARTRAVPLAGLFQLRDGGLHLGAPGIAVLAAPAAVEGTPTELRGTEVHVSLVAGRF